MTDIADKLAELGFRASREQVRALLTHAQKNRLSPAETVERLAEIERREREARNLADRTKRAALGSPKPMSDFEWDFPRKVDRALYEELAALNFVRAHQNVLFRGPAGVGKTMMAQNLGLLGLSAGMTVCFTNTASMLADLLKQESLPALERRMRRYTQVDLLACDELGYVPAVDTREVDLFFQVLSRRHEKASTIITTNLSFKAWGTVFPGAACLVALIDRFTQHLHILDIDGESYRQKDRGEDPPPSPAAAKPIPKKRMKRTASR